MNCLTMNLMGNKKLQRMQIVQPGNRLSVMPVEQDEFEEIVKMGR